MKLLIVLLIWTTSLQAQTFQNLNNTLIPLAKTHYVIDSLSAYNLTISFSKDFFKLDFDYGSKKEHLIITGIEILTKNKKFEYIFTNVVRMGRNNNNSILFAEICYPSIEDMELIKELSSTKKAKITIQSISGNFTYNLSSNFLIALKESYKFYKELNGQ